MSYKKFALVYNSLIENSSTVKDELLKILEERGRKVVAYEIDKLKNGVDFVIVIGGDGTFLKASRFYAKFSIPVFGINLGRLGFLSQAAARDLECTVAKILSGKFKVENRVMLKCEGKHALNDIVIKGSMSGRTSKFSLKINDKTVCDYLADGLIISTPTGSTAYGLSAGGPVLYPNLGAFVVVPICPHTLSVRPLVIPDSEKISIVAGEENSTYFLSADGQEFSKWFTKLDIEKSEYEAKLVLLDDVDFYSVLKNKFGWGTSPANL